MSLVVAEGISKSYGKVVAVDSLNLSLDEGSVTALIGPNGAGKTTTIKMILGLLKPDRGVVKVFSHDTWDNTAIRSMIGVVYEKAFFPSHQKIGEYLQRVCRIFGVPESRAMELLKLVNLEHVCDRKVMTLSAGMLQKFAVAHALVHKPRLIVADEMTANLDPQARGELLDLVLRLHRDEKVTFLLSSHILPELSRVCDSVAIITRDKVWAFGKLSELYDKYAIGIIRVSTNSPEAVAVEVRKLKYVKDLRTDIRGISVRVVEGKEDELYEDVPKLAKKVKAKVLGIETGSASLEELYRLAVSAKKGGK